MGSQLMIRAILGILLLAASLPAQIVSSIFFNSATASPWASTGTVTIAGASAGTLTNFTARFTVSDIKLATVANGGQIQNLCARAYTGVTYNVPCDLVLTSGLCDGSAITGSYTWGYDGDYSASAGTANMWVLIPTLTTSAQVIRICAGRASVSTYQGGAIGAEFDSNTLGRWHFPNGSSIAVADFSVNNLATTLGNATSAGAGKIDGAAVFVSPATASTKVANNAGFNATSFTVSVWLNTSGGPDSIFLMRDDFASSRGFYLVYHNAGGGTIEADIIPPSPAQVFSSATVGDGLWHHIVMTASLSGGTTTLTLYIDSVSQGTASKAASMPSITQILEMGNSDILGFPYTGSLDEVAFETTNRSSNWVATAYANQNAPPAIGAFTANSSGFVANQAVINVQ